MGIFLYQTVLYCSLLASAQTNAERNKIEEYMQGDSELARILHSLQETEQDDLVMEERARRQQARQSRVAADLETMDVDEDIVSAECCKKVLLLFQLVVK